MTPADAVPPLVATAPPLIEPMWIPPSITCTTVCSKRPVSYPICSSATRTPSMIRSSIVFRYRLASSSWKSETVEEATSSRSETTGRAASTNVLSAAPPAGPPGCSSERSAAGPAVNADTAGRPSCSRVPHWAIASARSS